MEARHGTEITKPAQTAPVEIAEIAFGAIGGSFAEAKATCGKPDCKRATGEKHKSCKLISKIHGKSKTAHIPKELVAEVKTWAAENRRLKTAIKEIAALSGQIIRLHVKIRLNFQPRRVH